MFHHLFILKTTPLHPALYPMAPRMLELVAAFICLTTLLTYVNFRFIGLPPTIGVMVTALPFSLLFQGLNITDPCRSTADASGPQPACPAGCLRCESAHG